MKRKTIKNKLTILPFFNADHFYMVSALLLMLALSTGCSHDQSISEDSGTVPLLVSGTCAGLTTKGSDPALPSGKSVGLYVTPKDAGISSPSFSNVPYTAGSSGSMSTDQTIKLVIGSDYDIYAYGPQMGTVTDATAIPFVLGMDVLWAPKNTLTGVSATSNTVTLGFTHRAAQIALNVVFADDFTAGSKVFTSSSTVQVGNFYSNGQLDLTTGVLTPSVPAPNVPINAIATGSAGSMTLGFPAICFIPAVGKTMTFAVKVTHEGKDYTGTITDTFLAGTSYSYTVTLHGYSTMLGVSGTLTDWIPVSGTVMLY